MFYFDSHVISLKGMSESFSSPMFGGFLGRACTAMDKLVSEDDTGKLEELVVVPDFLHRVWVLELHY